MRRKALAVAVTGVVFAALAPVTGRTAEPVAGTVAGSKALGATDIDCGGSVPVAVALDAKTGISGDPVDVELVLDRSGSMLDHPIAHLKAAAKSFVDLVDQTTDGTLDGVIAHGSRLGVVSFADGATVDVGLTPDAVAVKTAIDALRPDGLTNHSAAIATAQEQLAGSQPANGKVMVVMTDGLTTAGGDASDAAEAARLAGTEIFGIGLGLVDPAEIQDWTTDPDDEHYFVAPDPGRLQQVFAAIGAAIVVPAATKVTVVDTVASQFSAGGPVVGKGDVAPAGNQLTWTIPELRTEAVTLTYTATHDPAAGGGAWPVSVTVTYSDAEKHVVTFDNPAVNVRGCAARIDLQPGEPVTALVTDDFGDPVENVTVTYTALSDTEIRGCFTHAAGHLVCDVLAR
ncbi:vWA domain-containing protein [Actinosynnema sp. CA-248983]